VCRNQGFQLITPGAAPVLFAKRRKRFTNRFYHPMTELRGVIGFLARSGCRASGLGLFYARHGVRDLESVRDCRLERVQLRYCWDDGYAGGGVGRGLEVGLCQPVAGGQSGGGKSQELLHGHNRECASGLDQARAVISQRGCVPGLKFTAQAGVRDGVSGLRADAIRHAMLW